MIEIKSTILQNHKSGKIVTLSIKNLVSLLFLPQPNIHLFIHSTKILNDDLSYAGSVSGGRKTELNPSLNLNSCKGK